VYPPAGDLAYEYPDALADAAGSGQPLDTRVAPVVARISEVQALLVIAMVFAATAMARGFWF
jgi:hypothetical protein